MTENNGDHSVSLQKIEANRSNARRSTGPRTKEGKARSRQNALKHGILTSALLIRTGPFLDDANEFDELLEALQRDLAPEGKLEELLVEKIAVCCWREKRALKCEAGLTVDDLIGSLEYPSSWEGEELNPRYEATLGKRPLPLGVDLDQILRYETTIHRQLIFAINQLERMQRTRRGEEVPAPLAVQIAGNQ